MKKFMIGVLTAAMIMGAGTTTAFAGTDTAITSTSTTLTKGDFEYVAYDKYVEITRFNIISLVTDVVVPARIDGLPVTKIGNCTFMEATKIKSVTIPEGVTSIGEEAFALCTNLNTVTLPSTVTEINDFAFIGCDVLTDINLPDSLQTIGMSSFSGCKSLKSIDIPETVYSIGDGAFSNCIELEKITFPKGLRYIVDEEVCKGCTSLKEVNIQNGPSLIGSNAFVDCKSLEKIYIPISITGLFQNAENPFVGCTSLTDVYYAGTENQWEAINEKLQLSLTSTVVHFNTKRAASSLSPDVNSDGSIDASDASFILAYYAYTMTGGKGTIDEFMKK